MTTQHSALPSSSCASSTSVSCTSLQSIVSCKKGSKPMEGCVVAQQPLQPEIVGDEAGSCCGYFAANDDGAISSPGRCPDPKSSTAVSSHEELVCPRKHCNENVQAQAAEGQNIKLGCMYEEDHNSRKTQFNFLPSANPNCLEQPLEEGEGESHGDYVSSSVSRSPSLRDGSEESVRMNWRRLSPAAASFLCKDIEEEQEYFQQVLGSSSHGWTDEKHSSYLDSMEAGFLKSVMFKGRDICTQTELSSDLDDSASSHQAKGATKEFKVCQSGKWRPVLVQASFANVGPLKQLAVAVKNPWIKRFRASRSAYVPSLIMEDPLLEETVSCRSSHQLE